MSTEQRFAVCLARVRQFIHEPADAPQAPHRFNELALDIFALQFETIPILRRFSQSRGVNPTLLSDWRDIPALPAAAFKEMELTSLPAHDRPFVFHSSGTSAQIPSRHFHNAPSLALYEASLLPWFRRHLLSDAASSKRLRILSLTPSPALAPCSSLVHMIDTVRRESGSEDSRFFGSVDAAGAWQLDTAEPISALRESASARNPVLVLGTAFNFLHLLDHLAALPLPIQLPPGSRVMETGGYKGRSRAVPKAELHALITQRLGVPASHIICEYGMSELSSQAYDRAVTAAPDAPRCFRFPPWARVRIVSPETGCEVAEGETGLIRVLDLANVRSVLAIQTEDLGLRRGDGFELLGRAATAEPRGCSLMSLPASA